MNPTRYRPEQCTVSYMYECGCNDPGQRVHEPLLDLAHDGLPACPCCEDLAVLVSVFIEEPDQ